MQDWQSEPEKLIGLKFSFFFRLDVVNLLVTQFSLLQREILNGCMAD
jgi:hypothetical protein